MNAWKSLWRRGRRSIRKLAFPLLMGLGLGNPLCGQIGASISGTITDLTGGPLAGASVTVKNLETGAAPNIPADETGRHIASALEGWIYLSQGREQGVRAEGR